MSYNPDIWKKFLDNCHAEGIQLTVFDGRTARDFDGLADGGYEKIFVTFDEGQQGGSDREVMRKLTDLVRAGRDTRLQLHYEPWPRQGVAVSLDDLEKALTSAAA
jgi:hypothetical protein